MDLKKFEKQLGKLNKLYSTIVEDGEIGEIEKNFLKSYLIDLHNIIAEGQKESSSLEQEKTIPEKIEQEVEEVEIVKVKKEKKKEAPKPVEEAPVVTEEVVATSNGISTSLVQEESKEEIEVDTAVLEGEPSMEALFAEFSSKELGDKLSQIAIADLTKAWSINEKIFTIKELFAGDSEKFRQTVRALNDLADFSAAKSYLMQGVANEFSWHKESKFNKARNFIKLIKRRYN